MSEQTATLEFKVAVGEKGNVFTFDTQNGTYQFTGFSLSGYYGELAIPVRRGDTIEVLQNGISLTKAPMEVAQAGYEGHIAFLYDKSPAAAELIENAQNQTDFFLATNFNPDDVVKAHINLAAGEEYADIAAVMKKRCDDDLMSNVSFTPK